MQRASVYVYLCLCQAESNAQAAHPSNSVAYAMATCEIKLFYNFEITSVFYLRLKLK